MSSSLDVLWAVGFAPGAGGVVVGVGGLLGGALVFGDVAEVDADAVPDGGAAAHAVDEDVVFGEVGCGFGVFCFQRSRPASAAALSGVGDGDEWVFWGALVGALRLGCREMVLSENGLEAGPAAFGEG